MRMRKKKNLLPRMERCAALQIKDPIAHRGHWRELMPVSYTHLTLPTILRV